jgi:hypothetical protein
VREEQIACWRAALELKVERELDSALSNGNKRLQEAAVGPGPKTAEIVPPRSLCRPRTFFIKPFRIEPRPRVVGAV